METTELESAYRRLFAAAEALGDTGALPADTRASVDWTVGHIALSDRILAGAARDLLLGLPAVVDNREAMDARNLGALIASTTPAERRELLRRNGDDFVAAVRTIPGHAVGEPVELRLVDREGRPAPGTKLPWRELVRLRAAEHLPGHAARLEAARARG
ncbi:hypothetical protein ORV05_15680 [Amycolatopsis cynarae]|uniref:DinB-like domain-containing protein n=1 Tax=Amycolatopsis cynarae TaxID=2995223 RepID=A0ABY7B9U8_9PSEU|nr:hypothetical protein [Amycolatopsis sp. HUAS 11-8]WAL69139.1 hypothetical protein ORV05_15680 [Amycolatopsis sp. HUAS 11-8]